jgi:hypothetical protein
MVPNTSLKPADDLSVRVYSPQRAIKHPTVMLSELWQTSMRDGNPHGGCPNGMSIRLIAEPKLATCSVFVQPLRGAIIFSFVRTWTLLATIVKKK